MDKKLNFELKQTTFDRSRLRVYYGNMGEIIAQETLHKQGFEVWLPRPVADGKGYKRFFRKPPFNEIELRRRYEKEYENFRHIRGETWEEFLKPRLEYDARQVRMAKENRAFFGDQLEAFKKYLMRLENEHITYFFDLVAKKNCKIYLIEVKSTERAKRQFLKEEKLRGLMLGREYGFLPAVVTMNLKIEATYFKMEELAE